MPGPPRKPCFQPPVARSNQEKSVERGQPGWLEAIAEDMEKNLEKPKAGEAGWLVSMAEDIVREQEFGACGDTVALSGEMSSKRSSREPSQASQDFRSSGSVATGDSSSTLRPLSGSQLPSQSSSQKLSQSQDNSQPMSSQPSSLDVLASQAVSSQLLALAEAESQVNLESSRDVLVPGAEVDFGTLLPAEARCGVSKEVTASSGTLQDIFSPEDSGMPSPEPSLEEMPLPTQQEVIVSPSFDMFASSQEADSETKRGATVQSAGFSCRQDSGSVDASALLDKKDAAGLKSTKDSESREVNAMETSDGGQDAEADRGECTKVAQVEGSAIVNIESKLKSSSQSKASFMSAESESDEDEEVDERGKGKGITVVGKGKQFIDPIVNTDNADDEGSLTSALKMPDVSRLVVPGLLGAVLEKFGQKPDQATRNSKTTTAPLQVSEGCTGSSVVGRKNGVDEKSGKKAKVAKKSATPKKPYKLARVGPTSVGKVVKRRAPITLKPSKLKKSLASRSKFASSGSRYPQPQVSTASALLSLQKMRTAGTWVRCTIQECGKWRKLQEMDPSQVVSKWECRKNPDKENNFCAAPEAKWTPAAGWVHNRFTVGSLVWATVQGFPAWPAMVDDDPDTGSFFWTGVREDGEWELRPSHYHVVFFDQRAASRAWVLDGKMTSFSGLAASMKDTRNNARLMKAVQLAEDALKEDLVTRRARHCLAVRFKGPWGSVWPDWMEQQSSNAGSKEKELVINQRQPMDSVSSSESESDTSMDEDPEEREEVHMKDLLGNEEDDVEEAASQLMPADVVEELVGESNTAAEARVGSGLANLWQDASLFTQELSQEQTEKQQRQPETKGSDQQVVTLEEEMNVQEVESQKGAEAPAVDGTSVMGTSFQTELSGECSPSQELQVALAIAVAITPVKPPSDPGVSSTPCQDLDSKMPALVSTPSHVGVGAPNSLTTSTLDQTRKWAEEVDGEEGNLNNTAGSNAFSEEGSFMDI